MTTITEIAKTTMQEITLKQCLLKSNRTDNTAIQDIKVSYEKDGDTVIVYSVELLSIKDFKVNLINWLTYDTNKAIANQVRIHSQPAILKSLN